MQKMRKLRWRQQHWQRNACMPTVRIPVILLVLYTYLQHLKEALRDKQIISTRDYRRKRTTAWSKFWGTIIAQVRSLENAYATTYSSGLAAIFAVLKINDFRSSTTLCPKNYSFPQKAPNSNQRILWNSRNFIFIL